jgi:hypothetical protein
VILLLIRSNQNNLNQERKMNLRKSRLIIKFAVACVFVAATLGMAQQSRTKPQADIKVTYKSTLPGGTQSESTTMIKGTRQRSEQRIGYGMDQVSITQCDLRRTIQVSDANRKYMITPMESAESEGGAEAPAASASRPTVRGGVITSIITSTDTGERKEMFGFTARHVKTSVRMESSPDACNPFNMHLEQDGWYIDLNLGLQCDFGGVAPMMRPVVGGCRDRFRSRHVGAGRTGFPLIETTVGYDQSGKEQYRITKEVADLSRQPLDAALFDIPQGYAETSNSQDLYAMNPTGMMPQGLGNPPAGNPANQTGSPGEAGRPAAIRIGVVQLNNKTKASLSTDELRGRLVGSISNAGIEAVPLNAISLSEAQAEAKEKECAYILLTDISSLKAASAGKKLGGLLGRATGVDTGNAGKSEAKVDFKLFATGNSSAKLSSSESGREDGDEASLAAALDREAAAVVAAAQR